MEINKQYESFRLERDEEVATITLNRPEIANAFLAGFPGELFEALNTVAGDSHSRALVLQSEGRIFSAGAHFDVLKGIETTRQAYNYVTQLSKCVRLIQEMTKPVIAAVGGAAAGAGAMLALACDLVIASEKAKFVFSFVNLGLMPDTGGLWVLSQRVGVASAKEIAMLGQTLSANEALASGMVNTVVPVAELSTHTLAVANEIAAKPTLAVGAIKQLCNRIPEMTHDSYSRIEESMMAVLMTSADHREGVNAFIEKRAPRFTGE